MSVEVNVRECVPPQDERKATGRTNRSLRKVRPTIGKSRGAEQPCKSQKVEDHVIKTSVLHGKVKALKEQQIKERRKESVSSGDNCKGETSDDALVVPQLRTYLTEELLDFSMQGTVSPAQQNTWECDEFWGTGNSDGSFTSDCNGCKIANLSNFIQNTEKSSPFWPQDQTSCDDSLCAPMSAKTDAHSVSLAERVERNRQELRCKFNQTSCHSADDLHSGVTSLGNSVKDGSWVFAGDIDADSGVSIPVTEDCRELSVRHEQAKQLLHRARMKAKGASPLRASHCVLPHPNSQPPLHRGPSVHGGLTDGGSQSDSSNSDYCSWHKGSRGSSPSHVRFQDESEWDAEERYRERQQVPQTSSVTSTPPPRRHSCSPVFWTDQSSSSANGQCGACGSYLKGQGTSPAAIHGTNLRNVHLGSKFTQDGPLSSPLGGKPSPHWILPSQPWRIHTELIRETHIGGDSTADSSGEEDGSRNYNNKSRSWGAYKNCKNSTPNTSPGHGTILYPLNATNTDQDIEITNGTSSIQERRLKNNMPLLVLDSTAKTSDSNLEAGTVTRSNHVDSKRKMPQSMENKTIRKYKNSSAEPGNGSNTLNAEIGIGNIVLNVDTRQETYITDPAVSRTQTKPMAFQSDFGAAQGGFTSRVPIPPSGKAPTMVPSRNSRLTIRSEGIKQPFNVQGGDKTPTFQDRKGIQSDPMPTSKSTKEEALGGMYNYQTSTSSMKPKESTAREPSQKCKVDGRTSKDFKESRSSLKQQMAKELRDSEGSHCSSRKKDAGREHRDSQLSQSKEQAQSEMHDPKKEEKCSGRPRTNGQLHSNNAKTGPGKNICQPASPEISASPVTSTKPDRSMEAAVESPWQPEIKKGDIRSGMRKIFHSIGLSSRPKLERFQSSSLEQISPPDARHGDSESCDGSVKPGKIKKSPSLQSLKLMSPFHLPRKSSSVQNLLGKADRSSVYITGIVNNAPRRTLSVEDIGCPGMARSLGKVAKVYPDGTRLLELYCPEKGGFGFTISSGNGRPDSGIYVQEMSDANTAKLYSGLLHVGDEILEVNGAKVSTLGLGHVTEVMRREPRLSLRVLHQRRTKC